MWHILVTLLLDIDFQYIPHDGVETSSTDLGSSLKDLHTDCSKCTQSNPVSPGSDYYYIYNEQMTKLIENSKLSNRIIYFCPHLSIINNV